MYSAEDSVAEKKTHNYLFSKVYTVYSLDEVSRYRYCLLCQNVINDDISEGHNSKCLNNCCYQKGSCLPEIWMNALSLGKRLELITFKYISH